MTHRPATAESRRDEEEGGELDSHEEVRRICGSRRDEEEGGELDSQEEASPDEIKSREVVLGERERVGLLLLRLFPNGGATDIVFVTVLHRSWDSNYVERWSECNAGWTLP